MVRTSVSEMLFPLVPRRKIAGSGFGTWPTRKKGVGYDYAGSRPYVPGDDIRRIDHKASARRSAALGRDEFVVREHISEETAQVLIIVDRAPSMRFFPPELPWLSKPEAVKTAGALIIDSALQMRCLVGYLDFADWGRSRSERSDDRKPFWRPPTSDRVPDRVKERNLAHPYFTAPEENLAMAFEFLLDKHRDLQGESFVFVLSDFFRMPSRELLAEVAGRWDVIPVVLQDPTVERTFPTWKGVLPVALPITDAYGAQSGFVPFSGNDARAMRATHEKRFSYIEQAFVDAGLESVVIDAADPYHILDRFSAFMRDRQFLRM